MLVLSIEVRTHLFKHFRSQILTMLFLLIEGWNMVNRIAVNVLSRDQKFSKAIAPTSIVVARALAYATVKIEPI